MKTRITELLGIEKPIFQGGMAWVAEAVLAAAVSNAGGLGIIAAGTAPAEIIQGEIRRCRSMTDKPFGVNIMLDSPHINALADLIVAEKVPVVTTGAGSPGVFMERWKAAGVIVIPLVASTALAKRMERLGADAVVAEGAEAGGHIGELTTMTLVPQIVDTVQIPVVAAGGIADGRGFAAAFMLGAEAVQCGTVFLPCTECQIHPTGKQMVLDAGDRCTLVTGRGGHPVRSLKSPFVRHWAKLESQNTDPETLKTMGIGSVRKAFIDGDRENGSFLAGQIAALVKETKTAAETIDDMLRQGESLLTEGFYGK